MVSEPIDRATIYIHAANPIVLGMKGCIEKIQLFVRVYKEWHLSTYKLALLLNPINSVAITILHKVWKGDKE